MFEKSEFGMVLIVTVVFSALLLSVMNETKSATPRNSTAKFVAAGDRALFRR